MVSFALDILILRCWQITEVEIAVGHLKAKDPPQKKKKEQNLCKWICFFSGFSKYFPCGLGGPYWPLKWIMLPTVGHQVYSVLLNIVAGIDIWPKPHQPNLIPSTKGFCWIHYEYSLIFHFFFFFKSYNVNLEHCKQCTGDFIW